MCITQTFNFPAWIPDCGSHSPAVLDIFRFLPLIFVLMWLSLLWENLNMFSQFPLAFIQIQKQRGLFFIAQFLVPVLIRMVVVIIDFLWKDIFQLVASYVSANVINLLCLRQRSDRLVIVAKGLLKLPELLLIIK